VKSEKLELREVVARS